MRAHAHPHTHYAHRLVAAWRGLEVLHVTSVTSDDLPGDALACLVGAAALRELHLAADNASKAQLRLDLAWLPRGLQRLRLRHAFLPCPVTHERLPHLQALAMAHCTYACCGHLQVGQGRGIEGGRMRPHIMAVFFEGPYSIPQRQQYAACGAERIAGMQCDEA